ncbi:MAG: hypothetical protein JXO49_11280 [Deltaproteobacteria bacterium]|nr:hypothetical protein [Deltaproteobacteria bacterium]
MIAFYQRYCSRLQIIVIFASISLFFAGLLLLVPDRWFHSRFNTIIATSTPALAFLLLYGFYFTLTAEWLFWDEFTTSFNFIAIDYLWSIAMK